MDSKKVLLLAALSGFLLLGLLAPLFAKLLRTEVVEPGGWFAEPAAYTIIPWGSVAGWALFFAICGAAVLHPILRKCFHYKNAIARSLKKGEFGRAWELAMRFDEFEAVEACLRARLKLAGPELRDSILNALQHLRHLRASASDRLNGALTDDLRKYATGHAEKGLSVLGGMVERLVLLDRQAIDPRKVADRLESIRQTVDQLAEATEEARVQLANLSLGSERDNMAEEASASMRQVSQVAEELHQFDNAISLWESSSG
jgi:hypothetical protein